MKKQIVWIYSTWAGGPFDFLILQVDASSKKGGFQPLVGCEEIFPLDRFESWEIGQIMGGN